MQTLHEWNVIASVREREYTQAKAFLKNLGAVAKTGYYNILMMQVPDINAAMEELHSQWESDPKVSEWIAHFIPVTHRFNFNTAEEFEQKSRAVVHELLPKLANKSFHVRMQRRGFKYRLEASHEERLLGEMILQELKQAGTPARVTFDDPDAILVIETVDQHAGMAVWMREDFKRFPFLHVT